MKDSNVIDFDDGVSKPKTTLEKIKAKPKVSEYAEKMKLFLVNKGDGELTFEDYEKKVKKLKEKKNLERSKSRNKSKKRRLKSGVEISPEINVAKPKSTFLTVDDHKVNKSALKNKTTINDYKNSASKKSVRIRDNSGSKDSVKKLEQKGKKKLKFDLENETKNYEEGGVKVNKNGKKKIKNNMKRRQTQKLPNETEFKKLKGRLSVRI
jgi:hypothetical protein